MENSSIAPPPLPGQSKEKLSTGKKALLGCGIGCGTLFLIFLIVTGLGVWWMFSPGDQVSTTRILDQRSLGAIKVENISKNQGAMELINFFFQEAQKHEDRGASADLPQFFEKIRQYQQSRQNPAQWLKYIAPKEITLSITADEAGMAHLIVAANLNLGVRMAKTAFKIIFSADEVNRENVIPTPNGNLFKLKLQNPETGVKSTRGIIGFHKGTILYSDDIEPAKSGLEKLVQGDDNGDLRNSLSGSFNLLKAKEWLAYGVLDGEFWRSTSFGRNFNRDELLFQMASMNAGANVESADQVAININIDWRTEEAAQTGFGRVEAQKAEWIEKTAGHGLGLEVKNTLTGQNQKIEFELNNLKDAIVKGFKNLEAKESGGSS